MKTIHRRSGIRTALTGKAFLVQATGAKRSAKKNAGTSSVFLKGAAALVILCLSLLPATAQSRSEQELIDILKSGAGLQEKGAACAELKRVGTAQSVPVLAEVLTNEELSHSARYALESLPAPEAGLALIEALDKTSGLTKVGIIHSLRRRKEAGAISALSRLLGDLDPGVACAAATALGRIGGATATRALVDVLPKKIDAARRDAILDGLLTAASQELAEGRRESALTAFEKIYQIPVPDHVRTAAYRGMIASASPTRAFELVKSAIQGEDGPAQIAALEMARAIQSAEMTRTLCESLTKATLPMKVALTEGLRQRGDSAAAPSLAALVKSPDPAVRVAAIAGLGEMGDAAAAQTLLEAAGSTSDAEMRAGRQALLVLKRGDVRRALIEQLAAGQTGARVEAARALAGRGDKDAVPSLIRAVRENSDPVRKAVFLALGKLADVSDVPALVRLIAAAEDDAARDQACDALAAACQRLQVERGSLDAGPIMDGLVGADPQTRAALLQAGSVLADERLRTTLRNALSDSDSNVRESATRALCETRDPGLLPDLLNLARRAPDLHRRVPAVRGYIRLVTDTESVRLSPAERVNALQQVLSLTRAEERWAMLAGLGKIPDPVSLELVLSMLDDPTTRAEAAQALTEISKGLKDTHREEARMALEKVLAAISDPDQRQAALEILQQIDPNAGSASPVEFRRIQVDGAFRSEGVAVADFNRDGRLDIDTGNVLYLGPDWKPQPMLGESKEYKPENYSDEFLCFADDLDRDGWTDLVVVGFPGAMTRWLRNPGRRGGAWKEFLAIEKTGNESPDWVDVDKDGRQELVFVSENGMAFARPGPDPTKPWPVRVIAAPDDPRPGHGLGVGDINGDGRNDVVCPEGWWEGPASPAAGPWTFHLAKLGFEAPAQMLVFDVNGDGRPDVVSSGAHRYGLWWYEQSAEGWQPHEIDHSISQLHALHLADINRDGLPDLVTGKRFWAHREGDDGIDDPAVVCWFEMKRENGKLSWIRHDIDFASGVGLHFQIVDLNGDGLPDIVTSNKKGVYVFMQEKR